MPIFRYQALDRDGALCRGSRDAVSAYIVGEELRRQGFTVLKVDAPRRQNRLLRAPRMLNGTDLHFLAQELAAVAKGGLPLTPSLRALGEDVEQSRLKVTIDDLAAQVEQGKELHAAIEQAGALPPLFASLARAGEQTGNLAGVLQLLAEHTQRTLRFQHAMRMALAYPAALLAASSLVMLFLLFVVLPEYGDAFRGIQDGHSLYGLPLLTRFWVEISEWLRTNWTLVAGAVVAAVAAWIALARLLRRSASGRRLLDRLALGVPFTGRLRYLAAVARFSRTLALLLKSGVAVPDALALAGDASDNARIQHASIRAIRGAVTGGTLAESLEASRVFGRDFLWLVSTAEEHGEPQAGLEAIADRYELEITLREKMLGAFASPAVIIVIGIIIASIMAAIYLPAMNAPTGSAGTGTNMMIHMFHNGW